MAVSARGSLSAGRFLGCLVATAAVGFGLVWACMLWCPLAVFGGNHVMWAAKDLLLRQCGLGSTIVVGDFRPQNGIIPVMLPEPTTNLATGGFSTIETYFLVKQALLCRSTPKRVIISLSPTFFIEPTTLWTNAAQVGLLTVPDLRDIVRNSSRLGDNEIDRVERENDLPDWLRVWLYPARFPPINFADMLDGLPFARYADNSKVVSEQVRSRGFYPFSAALASPGFVAHDGKWPRLTIPPILDLFFDRTLAILDERGIEADFIAMPVNQATADAMRRNILGAFSAYLHGYEARYSNFRVVGNLAPVWPDAWFADDGGHLVPGGAAIFSKYLGTCMTDLSTWDRRGAPPTTCDLSWDAVRGSP